EPPNGTSLPVARSFSFSSGPEILLSIFSLSFYFSWHGNVRIRSGPYVDHYRPGTGAFSEGLSEPDSTSWSNPHLVGSSRVGGLHVSQYSLLVVVGVPLPQHQNMDRSALSLRRRLRLPPLPDLCASFSQGLGGVRRI